MKKMFPYLIILLLAAGLGALAYFVTTSWIYFGTVSLLGALVGYLVYLMLQNKKKRIEKRKQCYRFANSFIISYSSTGSLDKAYGSAIEGNEGEYSEVLDGIVEQSVSERIKYLQGYFESDLYKMFASLFSLFEVQGGDLLKISKGLLDEFTHDEEDEQDKENESRRNMLQYIVLWGMSLLIIAFLRVGLNNFYSVLLSSPVYLICLGVYFLFFDISIYIYFLFYSCSPSPLKILFRRKKA